MARLIGLNINGQAGTVVEVIERTRPPEEGTVPSAFYASLTGEGKARVMLPPATWLVRANGDMKLVELKADGADVDVAV